MPIVQSRALSISVSSPIQGGKETIDAEVSGDFPALVMPIELKNGCSEEGIDIDSDNILLTNAIRKHYLEHFGHRDLSGIVSDYSRDATIIHQVENNQGGEEKRCKYHGHEEIRSYYDTLIFPAHPEGDCTFRLERIECSQKHAIVTWSAKTPTLAIDQGTETFVFNSDNKICKKFLSCETHERDNTSQEFIMKKRRSSSASEYGEFFKE